VLISIASRGEGAPHLATGLRQLHLPAFVTRDYKGSEDPCSHEHHARSRGNAKYRMNMASTEARELELLRKVELRIGLADTDQKLQNILGTYLPPVLLKLASEHASVRNKVGLTSDLFHLPSQLRKELGTSTCQSVAFYALDLLLPLRGCR